MITVSDLRNEYQLGTGRLHALKGINLDVAAGEFFTLLGPSGCGKTTALRSIAGLERPTGGAIAIDGRPVFSAAGGIHVPPNRRDIAMVFQSYAIWPHMTVGQNVAFPLETMPITRAERTERVRRALDLVGLGDQMDRPAPLLSGGQQQRVALARALVKGAKVLLLDEPLSNLDAKLREQMCRELRALQRRLGTTTVYVTHDQDEALSMSDRIALMRDGLVIEIGTPEDLYLRPRRRFTAEFLGRAVVLPGTPANAGGAGQAMITPLGTVVAAVGREIGERARFVVFRPEHAVLRAPGPAGENIWRGRIAFRHFSGRIMEYGVTINGIEIPVHARSGEQFAPGDVVDAFVAPAHCILLEE